MRRIASLLGLLAFTTPLAAGDALRTPGEQVLDGLERALATGDDEAAVGLLAEVGGLYRYPASPQEANALLKLAGRAARSGRERVVVAALDALGATGARSAAGEIERFLRSAKPKRSERPQVLAAIGAAGRLHAPALIAPLLNLARSAGDAVLAEQSLLALGAFDRAGTAVRRDVTQKLLDLARALQRNRLRWTRLRAAALRALQRLVGRRMNSVAQFGDWWKTIRDRKDPWRPQR